MKCRSFPWTNPLSNIQMLVYLFRSQTRPETTTDIRYVRTELWLACLRYKHSSIYHSGGAERLHVSLSHVYQVKETVHRMVTVKLWNRKRNRIFSLTKPSQWKDGLQGRQHETKLMLIKETGRIYSKGCCFLLKIQKASIKWVLYAVAGVISASLSWSWVTAGPEFNSR